MNLAYAAIHSQARALSMSGTLDHAWVTKADSDASPAPALFAGLSRLPDLKISRSSEVLESRFPSSLGCLTSLEWGNGGGKYKPLVDLPSDALTLLLEGAGSLVR